MGLTLNTRAALRPEWSRLANALRLRAHDVEQPGISPIASRNGGLLELRHVDHERSELFPAHLGGGRNDGAASSRSVTRFAGTRCHASAESSVPNRLASNIRCRLPTRSHWYAS
jgi:hypothetical protein